MTYEECIKYFKYYESTGVVLNETTRNYRAKHGFKAGWLWQDKKKNKKYLMVKFRGKTYPLHRVIWLYMTGELPIQVDHIDGDTLNNKWDNLRSATNMENSKNRGIQSNNTSGYHGINQLPSGNFRARINVDGKRITLGTFSSFEKALKARKEAEVKYGYFKNHGRVNNVS